MMDNSFDYLSFLRMQGYIVPTESFNPEKKISEAADALTIATNKAVSIRDVERMLMTNDVIS
jgi:hypothetical protein